MSDNTLSYLAWFASYSHSVRLICSRLNMPFNHNSGFGLVVAAEYVLCFDYENPPDMVGDYFRRRGGPPFRGFPPLMAFHGYVLQAIF